MNKDKGLFSSSDTKVTSIKGGLGDFIWDKLWGGRPIGIAESDPIWRVEKFRWLKLIVSNFSGAYKSVHLLEYVKILSFDKNLDKSYTRISLRFESLAGQSISIDDILRCSA